MAVPFGFFISRQPITDRQGHLRGYELAFRGAAADVQAVIGPETQAAARVLTDGLLLDGLQSLTGNVPAFVHFSEELLEGDFGLLLTPVDNVVVQLGRDVRPTPKVLQACNRLRSRGVRVALDGVVSPNRVVDFAGHIDIVRVDLEATDPGEIPPIAMAGRRQRAKLLAAHVESRHQLEAALEASFDYFQGWEVGQPTFAKPVQLPGIPIAYFRLRWALTVPDVSANEIDRLVMADPSLAYRLLRYANSAGAGQLQAVNSIHRAILLFGQSELRRAVDLFILSNIAPGTASHLLEQALTRARFCETIAFRLKRGAQCPDYALAGLLSNLDLLVGMPLDCALANLPLEEETLAALLGRQGLMGEVLNLAIAYEAGRWDEVRVGCASLGLNEALLPVVHLRAVTGAHNLVAAA